MTLLTITTILVYTLVTALVAADMDASSHVNSSHNETNLMSEKEQRLEESLHDKLATELDQINGDLPTFPTESPTALPSGSPSHKPTASRIPSFVPTRIPSQNPSMVPTDAPSARPSGTGSDSPSALPTNNPTKTPTDAPTNIPTKVPTDAPTTAPSGSPSAVPTSVPSTIPSRVASSSPSAAPSSAPSRYVCESNEIGVFGVGSTSMIKIMFQYELETTPNTYWSLETEMLPAIEKKISDKLLPTLFPDSCAFDNGLLDVENVETRRSRRKLTQVVTGLSPLPTDEVLLYEACRGEKTNAIFSCYVIQGYLTIFIQEGNSQLETEQTTLSTIKGLMDNDRLISAHREIVKLSFVGEEKDALEFQTEEEKEFSSFGRIAIACGVIVSLVICLALGVMCTKARRDDESKEERSEAFSDGRETYDSFSLSDSDTEESSYTNSSSDGASAGREYDEVHHEPSWRQNKGNARRVRFEEDQRIHYEEDQRIPPTQHFVADPPAFHGGYREVNQC